MSTPSYQARHASVFFPQTVTCRIKSEGLLLIIEERKNGYWGTTSSLVPWKEEKHVERDQKNGNVRYSGFIKGRSCGNRMWNLCFPIRLQAKNSWWHFFQLSYNSGSNFLVLGSFTLLKMYGVPRRAFYMIVSIDIYCIILHELYPLIFTVL